MRLLITLFTSISMVTVLGPGSAFAKSALTDIDIFYRLYVGGGKLAEINLNARLGEGKYSVQGNAKSVGFLGNLAKVVMIGTSSGLIVGDDIRPLNHEYKLDERGRRKRKVVMAYDKAGRPNVLAQPAFRYGSKRAPITKEQMTGTIDPVASFVVPVKAGISVLSPSQCDRAASIFDGRQRYDIKLKHKASYGAYRTKGSDYRGPAIRCSVRFRPVAGYRKAGFISDLSKRKAVIDVVFVPAGNGKYLVPLRIRFPTPVGQAVFQAVRFNSRHSDAGGGS